jgi:hypothetical protein
LYRIPRSSDRRHDGKISKEFPIQDYLDGAERVTNLTTGDTIVLLTDDQGAIDEAVYLHPEYNWLYIDRKRNFGKTKRNQHTPSKSPSLEFLNIYADLKMAAPCRTLIHGTSNMVDFIINAMKESASADRMVGGDRLRLVTTYQIDEDKSNYSKIDVDAFMTELVDEINAAKQLIDS